MSGDRRRAWRSGPRGVTAALVVALAAAVASSCAAGRQMLAPAGELDQYRRARTGATFEARLHDASEYLYAHPKGVFADELAAWVDEVEPRYFEQHWTTPARLRRYLEVLPHGPHADQVRARLERMNDEAAAVASLERKRDEDAERRLGRLRDAEERRRRGLDAVVAALSRLAQVRSFGRPAAALPAAFRADLEPPDVACHPEGCYRQRVLPYAVPSPDGLIERELRWTVGYDTRAGLVERVFITGYSLFDRLAEVATMRRVAEGDGQGRMDAIQAAATIVRNTVETALPQARCERTPVSPVVVHRDCDGLALWVVAGPNPEAPDFIELRASAPAVSMPQP